jgi:glucosamine 6-phosphate synthetase-like amidotransferase/phosphosugar isomerase protein
MSPSPYTEDTLVQQTTANYLHEQLGWESVYANNTETFGLEGNLGRGINFPLALDDFLLPKVKSNLKEVQARGGKIIALTHKGANIQEDDTWVIPKISEPLSSFFVLPALQLFAYEMAVYLGKDVDQPRNLAKSVTVE